MRRSAVLKGYLVIVSLGEIESRSFVARREELEILRRFFTGALKEIFCEKDLSYGRSFFIRPLD
jgi:hypothetical protein